MRRCSRRRCSRRCIKKITEITECDLAAVALGLADTTAEDDERKRSSSKPSGCYFDSRKLKMNVACTNRGYCSLMRPCLCKQPTLAPTMYPTFAPTDTAQLSSETPTVIPTTRFPTTQTPTLPNYLLVDSGLCILHISSTQDCERAAAEIQLSDWCRRSQRQCDTTVQEDGKSKSKWYPQGCYFKKRFGRGWFLMMNVDGTNTAKCSTRNKCLCKSTATHAPVVITNIPTELPTTPSPTLSPTQAPTSSPTKLLSSPDIAKLLVRCGQYLNVTLNASRIQDVNDDDIARGEMWQL